MRKVQWVCLGCLAVHLLAGDEAARAQPADLNLNTRFDLPTSQSNSTQEQTADTSAELANQYWPQWRGPLWNGVAPHGAPPLRWSEQKNLCWKAPIEGTGHGTPVIWGERIFLQTAIPLDKDWPVPDVIPDGTPNIEYNASESIGKWKPQRFMLVCLNRQNGQPLWKRKVHEAMPHQGHHLKGGFASQSPVTDGKLVFAYFGSFGLYCFDFSGKLIWKKEPKPQAMEAGLGEGSSPALFGNKLVIVVDTELQSYVVAFNKNTGEEIWRTNRDEVSNWSTPRIFTYHGRQQVVVNGATVRSYDLENGELIWKCGGHTASAIPMPAVGHGMVFNTSGWSQDVLQAIRLGQRGDLTESKHVVWSLNRDTPYVPCPMLWGDELYLLDDRSFFSCYNAVDGSRHYKYRLRGRRIEFSASPVAALDRIYLLSEEGKTFVMQKGTRARLLAVNKLDGKFYASPVIVGNQIFLRSHQHLYCFATEDTTEEPE